MSRRVRAERDVDCPLCLDECAHDLRAYEDVAQITLWIYADRGERNTWEHTSFEPPSLEHWEIRGMLPDCGHDRARGFHDLIDEKVWDWWADGTILEEAEPIS